MSNKCSASVVKKDKFTWLWLPKKSERGRGGQNKKEWTGYEVPKNR